MIRVHTPPGEAPQVAPLVAVAYRLEREGAQVFAMGEGTLDGYFHDFSRAAIVLLALVRSFHAQNPSRMAIALTQAVLTKSPTGKLTLSGRTETTLKTIIEHAPDGAVIGTQQLQTMVGLESRDYLPLFQTFLPAVGTVPRELGSLYQLKYVDPDSREASAGTAQPRTRSLHETGEWVPLPGAAREAIVTATQKALAEVIGPMAQVIAAEAVSRAGTFDDVVSYCTSMVPAAQQEPVRQSLDQALFGRSIHH
jgi:hypothetical protein